MGSEEKLDLIFYCSLCKVFCSFGFFHDFLFVCVGIIFVSFVVLNLPCLLFFESLLDLWFCV
jgi:hypothetical protein